MTSSRTSRKKVDDESDSSSGRGSRKPKKKVTKANVKPKSRVAASVDVVSKSPAEFFAEHQSIAGFDNPGKSLYTTIRELVENSLDACETVNILPDVTVRVEEMSQEQFQKLLLENKDIVVADPFTMKGGEKNIDIPKNKKNPLSTEKDNSKGEEELEDDGSVEVIIVPKEMTSVSETSTAPSSVTKKPTSSIEKKVKSSTPGKDKTKVKVNREGYFRIQVRDNGCGMAHDAIPNLIGRVLSGSKYGVRQTRGKFGLGAKMALIWSKKSTGIPIQIVTSQMEKGPSNKQQHPSNTGNNNGGVCPGSHKSTCVLDIDVRRNEPRILKHTREVNTEGWTGTQFSLVISGNWTTYRSRIVQYFRQLAIITPYATLRLEYCDLRSLAITTENNTSTVGGKTRDLTLRYDRRSEQMPPPAREVKHHPLGIHHLLVTSLLERTKANTLAQFLTSDLAGVGPTAAKTILGPERSQWTPSDLSDADVHRLVQDLRNSTSVSRPDASCLSPLGEYNLNLGVRKVIGPDAVATARDRPSAYEGHSFLVEAAVSLGGSVSASSSNAMSTANSSSNMESNGGVTVYRFANRIPLLFEGGADVVTRVANSFKWSNYKIDPKRDRVGVFVSIVSTKIPFKGTGKEYIGTDITEIHHSVRRTLQACCQQLRSHLMARNAQRERVQRRGKLLKYVPNISRSIFDLLEGMAKRKREDTDTNRNSIDSGIDDPRRAIFRRRLEAKEITEKTLMEGLTAAVESENRKGDEDDDDDGNTNGHRGSSSQSLKKGGRGSGNKVDRHGLPVRLRPVTEDSLQRRYHQCDNNDDHVSEKDDSSAFFVIDHPLFSFVPLEGAMVLQKT